MISDRAICTIIAKNYVAFARTLVQSFQRLHPDVKCYVLIVDDFDGYISPADESFQIVSLADLSIPNLSDFCFRYSIKELCTATKAHLLDFLIREKSVDRLIYLDPDMLVTGTLDQLFEQLRSYDIVLTPHLDADYPDDGLLPDDGYILRAGQFNLGLIGVNSSANANRFLEWWKPKLNKRCVVDLSNGYFVDQKFIDFVPIFFDNFLIERDTGYNVAYWNLHSRRLSEENGAWKCNDDPLYCFHFSGYDPETGEISRYIPPKKARHHLSDRADLKSLFEHYQRSLNHNGHKQTSTWPYTFGYFKTGEPIPDNLRHYYRNRGGEDFYPGDPFESEELRRQAAIEISASAQPEQITEILNTRAWRWVCRYVAFKSWCLTPIQQLSGRLLRGRRDVIHQSEE